MSQRPFWTDTHASSRICLWATPAAFFNRLNEEFSFTLNACASAENAKCRRLRLVEASIMLHHVPTDTTSRLYCGKASHRATLEAPGAERGVGGAQGTPVELELERVRQELAAAKQRCREAEGRAVSAEARATWAEDLLKGSRGRNSYQGGPRAG